MKKPGAWFDHLTIPQVVLILGSIALAVTAAVLIPEEKWSVIPWESVLAIAISGGAGLGALAMRPRPEAERPSVVAPSDPVPPRPRRASRSSEGGSVGVDLLLDVLGFVACTIAAIWLALSVHGCGSTLRVHATIADVAGATLDSGCSSVKAQRHAELEAAVDAHEYAEEAAAAVDVVRERWSPWLTACELASTVHDAWVDRLTLASVSGTYDLSLALEDVGRLLAVWQTLAGGGYVPDPPAELLALVPTEGAQ